MYVCTHACVLVSDIYKLLYCNFKLLIGCLKYQVVFLSKFYRIHNQNDCGTSKAFPVRTKFIQIHCLGSEHLWNETLFKNLPSGFTVG